ncbi:MAG: hypothetical protein AB7O52_09605 [Planctomycetota bacterium]
MIPWQVIDRATVPRSRGKPGQGEELAAGTELVLSRRSDEFSIRVGTWELMNSRSFDSEKEIAEFAWQRLSRGALAAGAGVPGAAVPCVLVGGLGMGFTLRAALDHMPTASRVVVAELVPEVVRWNRDHLGHLAGHPLNDPRVEIHLGDVADRLRAHPGGHDAVVLDVDNGPHTKSSASEGWLYSPEGLKVIRRALRPNGVLSIWSAGQSPGFTERVAAQGFRVQELGSRGRGGKGFHHRIWIAVRQE